jgi:hypothetical protein
MSFGNPLSLFPSRFSISLLYKGEKGAMRETPVTSIRRCGFIEFKHDDLPPEREHAFLFSGNAQRNPHVPLLCPAGCSQWKTICTHHTTPPPPPPQQQRNAHTVQEWLPIPTHKCVLAHGDKEERNETGCPYRPARHRPRFPRKIHIHISLNPKKSKDRKEERKKPGLPSSVDSPPWQITSASWRNR